MRDSYLELLSLYDLWTLHEEVTSKLIQKLELEREQLLRQMERTDTSDFHRSRRSRGPHYLTLDGKARS